MCEAKRCCHRHRTLPRNACMYRTVIVSFVYPSPHLSLSHSIKPLSHSPTPLTRSLKHSTQNVLSTDVDWIYPEAALSLADSNTTYTNTSLYRKQQTTTLIITDFSFNISLDALIVGVGVSWVKWASGTERKCLLLLFGCCLVVVLLLSSALRLFVVVVVFVTDS